MWIFFFRLRQCAMPRRRDSRSRTPPRSHRRSQDFSSGRASRHRSRARSPQNTPGSSNQMPRTWKQTSHEWDSNRVYGLTPPKIVVSNRPTREQGIAGMSILDVPLYKVISGGNNNWALRQVAHGRTGQWENFRSRQEAIFCGVLMRALRSDQAEQEGTDFVTVLKASQKKYFPASDLHDWTARYNTIKRLAEDMVKGFRKKAPVQTNQTLLTRLQTLESENARLKGQASRSTRADPNPNPRARS